MKKRRPWFRKAPPLGIEFLEDRVTPATVFDLFAGTLTVFGTPNGDTIGVTMQFPNFYSVTMNDSVRDFSAIEVLRLHILADSGNDTVSVAQNVLIIAWINAGPGDDLVFGGSGDDRIDGGAGKDQIEGGAGDDIIRGGLGDDSVSGGAGDDQIYGDEHPELQGAPEAPAELESVAAMTESADVQNAVDLAQDSADTAGNDQLFGDAGNDTIQGGAGNDLILGGTGNDVLLGQAGNDTIEGGAGNDEIDGGPGADRLAGDAGDDTVNSDAQDTVVDTETVYVTDRASDPVSYLQHALDITVLLSDGTVLSVQTTSQQDGAGDATTAASPILPSPEAAVSSDELAGSAWSDALTIEIGGGGWGIQQASGASNAEDSLSIQIELYGTGSVSEQVDLLLQGAILTEATFDGPDHSGFVSQRKERRRPTFLYIRPLPLPDLIPDIEIKMPGK